MEFNNKVYGN